MFCSSRAFNQKRGYAAFGKQLANDDEEWIRNRYRGIRKLVDSWKERKDRAFLLRYEDLANHRSEWVDPVSTNYRGWDVYELPPNGQGIAALQILNVLEGFDLASMGRDSVEFWHTLVEAKKLAYEDRARFYADPAMAELPIERLLSKEYARRRAARIDPARAARQGCADRRLPGFIHPGSESGGKSRWPQILGRSMTV